jgi:glycine cleavage system H protein
MSEEYKIESGLYYTKEHEWAKKTDEGLFIVGITDYAQSQLHEIVYGPIAGKIVEINEELLDSPELINEDPYGEGWIAKLEPTNLEAELNNLMNEDEYKEHVAVQTH